MPLPELQQSFGQVGRVAHAVHCVVQRVHDDVGVVTQLVPVKVVLARLRLRHHPLEHLLEVALQLEQPEEETISVDN